MIGMRFAIAVILMGMSIVSSGTIRNSNSGFKISESLSDTVDQCSLKPENLESHKVIRLANSVLNVVFTDNSANDQDHLAGYNGITELTHMSQDSSVFHPFVAGFNLEHIFGGDSLTKVFEPRKHPMELYKVSDKEVLLYQSPTPLSGVESQTVFRLTDSHYIDITYRFRIHEQKFFRHGYAGLFWASYIDAPADRNIYFHGYERGSDSLGWISAYSSAHGLKSTHVGRDDTDSLYFAPNINTHMLFHDLSDYIYEQPFYYGRFHNMVLAFMFQTDHRIRFSQSPSSGLDEAIYPAWDFQFIVPDFEVGRIYSFEARIMYKVFAGADDVLGEFEVWKKTRED